ncbi:hypothetical protein LXN10_01035 [Arcobacter sp. KX21116]|uniref:hypothetical protein n=1 Tax=Arcobacter iocasae TaxID=2906515 RepID=UPI0035D490A3
MTTNEELDENTKKLVGKTLSFEELQKNLNNTSPLQMSKKLIEIEIYDQQSSLEVMDKIYEEFESGQNVINELVNPMLLGIADGLVKHPKLNGSFRKSNITPSRLVNEVNNFRYEECTEKDIDDDVFLTQAEKTYYNNEKKGMSKDGKEYNKYFHRNSYYDTKKREQTQAEKGLSDDDIKGMDMDHVNPINHIRKKYQNNPYLYRDDLPKLIGMGENENYENSSLNRSKNDDTWSEYINKKLDYKKPQGHDKNGNILDDKGSIILTKEEQEKKLKLEKKATEAQNKEARKIMAKNIGLKGLGDAIILLLKPIWFEIKDIFKNGILYGFDTDDKIEAFILRIKRAGKYIKDNALKTLVGSLKEVFDNFIPMLLENILKSFLGMFKKFIEIVTQGFMSIKEAFKIMMKSSKEMSPAQKADAITKIIATAVVPILMFTFEESIFSFLKGTPFDFLKDVAMIILSGLTTTIFVWLLDQIDLFSVKDEKRLSRVKEIFQLRIENIKNNTDIFEKESIEILAKQKLCFTKIIEDMNESIDNNLNINDSVYKMADFTNIDLKVKSTDDFLFLLNNNEKLVI